MLKLSASVIALATVTSALVMAPPTGAEPVTVTVPFTPLATVYQEDYELGDGGWAASGVASSWALGTPTAGPSGAWSGLNAWGTNLAGNYNNNECSFVAGPAIALPGAGASAGVGVVSAARLAFKHWMTAENRYDGGVVQVSTDDGASWSIVAPPGGYPVSLLTSARKCLLGSTEPNPPAQDGWSGTMSANASAWLDGEVDLTAFLGQTIRVRFAFGTDGSVVKTGWYVDDVVVQVGAGAVATANPEVPETSTFTPLTSVYAEDFELGDGGFTASGAVSTWAHGAPAYASGPSVAASGANAWGTNLTGNYRASECSRLVSPPIELPGAGAPIGAEGVTVEVARLFFRQWMFTESRYDGGLVQVSTDDGATWTTLQPSPEYTNTANTAARACLGLSTTDLFMTGPLSTKPDSWTDVSADLTPFLGQTVRVAWAFASDTSVHYAGWYVDDVAVQVGAGASVEAPELPTIDPMNATIPFTPVLTAYEEGFEDGWGGWTAAQHKVDQRALRNQYNSTWAWGTPAYSLGPAATFGKSWVTNLTGQYKTNECSAVVSPAIDLTGVTPGSVVSLAYKHWYKSESAYDAGVVEASTDGATWVMLNPTPAYPVILNNGSKPCLEGSWSTSSPTQLRAYSGSMSATNTSWLDGAVDLSAYAGRTMQVRMRFSSDASVVNAGWAFDNVALSVDGSPVTTWDFESGTQGWTVALTPIPLPMSWDVGAPTDIGGAATGAGALGTRMNGNYADGECTSVTSPVIDLTDAPADLDARLVAKQWLQMGTGDVGLVQMRVDGGDWNAVTPDGGYPTTMGTPARACMGLPTGATGLGGGTGGWSDVSFNLTDVAGHTVEFRVFLGADNSTTATGWYWDDVRVVLGAGGMTVGSLVPDAPEDVAFDARLQDAIARRGPQADSKWLTVIVGGPEIEAPLSTPASRELWSAYFAEQAAPFLAEVRAHAEANQGEVLAEYPAAPAAVVKLPRDAVFTYGEAKTVERVTLDDERAVSLIQPEVPADDGGFETMNRESVPMTQAPDVWALGYRGEGIKLAIIDTGIFAGHPAFAVAPDCTTNRVAYWRDFVANQAAPYDDNGHGTHVAGTAAGSTECGARDNGVAPKATLMGIKFLDSGGGGSFANALASLQWAFDNGADATSNSWGASSCSASLDTIRLVNNLARAGMPSAFAAGNNGASGFNTIGNPACADFAITVGATQKDMVLASFSSKGSCADPTEGNVQRVCPDIVAVGQSVVSSVPTGSCSLCDPTGYRSLNGTSMATPHVGGALALMIQFKRALTGTDWDTANKAEETAMKLTALDLGTPGEDNMYGAGFIQLLPIYNLLANPGVPDVRDSLTVPTSDLRVGNTANLAFRVSNAGTRAVTGQFTVTWTTPDGSTVLDDRNVTLDFGGGASHTMTLAVNAATAAGEYTYAGDFVYSWIDDENVIHTGEVRRSGSFLVKKVDIRVGRGMPVSSPVGAPMDVVVTLENRGNEDARNLTFEETVRDAYVFLPGEPDPFNPNWLYGSPPPDDVRRDTSFGRVTLKWIVGDFPAGSTLELRYTVVPTKAGTFPFVGIVRYSNEIGQGQVVGSTTAHTATAG